MVGALALLIACGRGGDDNTPTVEEPVFVGMDDLDLLTRASLDLRGVRPTVEELEAVSEGTESVDVFIEDFIQDQRFGRRVRDMMSYSYLTRVETYSVLAQDYGLEDDIGLFTWAVGEEVLRIISTIAEDDLPWSTVVTADWTMADEFLGEAWPVDYPTGETGWMQVEYTDGRPKAGILSTNGMWWRYGSTTNNANRGRANAISRLLLCSNFLSRSVEFDRSVNLLDEDALNDALRNNPGCVACHVTLDPLAAHMWGFFYVFFSGTEMGVYHAERENKWEEYNGVEPGYFGTPTYDIEGLGDAIVDDPRLNSCLVETVFEGLVGRPVELDDTERLLTHMEDFERGGTALRPLIASVINGPEYRAQGAIDDERFAHKKMLRPEQMVSQVEQLTGYAFTYYGYDFFQTDKYGVRTLAGGVDGQSVLTPVPVPTATMVLVHERLAEAASWWVVMSDFEEPSKARLFIEIDFTETVESDPAAITAQLQLLYALVLSQLVSEDSEEVQRMLGLWVDLYEAKPETDEERILSVWTGVLSAMLRDPDFLFY